jgi:hypothetical protein
MKTELQKRLAIVAPSICIRTIWEHDADSRFDELTAPGCCFENESPEDWEAWQSEIECTAILESEEITGSAYLGGTWEEAGDNPAESNPEISGYENQMTQEALKELISRCTNGTAQAALILTEANAALDLLKQVAAEDYAKQRAEIA